MTVKARIKKIATHPTVQVAASASVVVAGIAVNSMLVRSISQDTKAIRESLTEADEA